MSVLFLSFTIYVREGREKLLFLLCEAEETVDGTHGRDEDPETHISFGYAEDKCN